MDTDANLRDSDCRFRPVIRVVLVLGELSQRFDYIKPGWAFGFRIYFFCFDSSGLTESVQRTNGDS